MTQPLRQCCAQHMAATVLIRVLQRLSHTFSLERSLDVWVMMRAVLPWEHSRRSTPCSLLWSPA